MEKIEKKKYKEIEIRSDEVQEVMGKIPHWILRWGITVLFVIVVILFIGCYFFKYPDTLNAEVILTTTTPPVSVMARSTGKLDRVFVANGQVVESGELLAVIQNTADYEDILLISEKLNFWIKNEISLQELNEWMKTNSLKLGVIQNTYSSFFNSVQEYLVYQKQNYYPQKIQIKQQQNEKQEEIFARMQQEKELGKQLTEIASSLFYRDSVLYAKEITTGEDYDHSLQNYLQSQQNILSRHTTEKQMEMQQLQNEETLLDLEMQYEETRSQYARSLQISTDQLLTALKAWEQEYVMRSSIEGTVNLMGIWSPNQNVTAGDLVFIILPAHPDAPMGKALLPAAGAGKVKHGQRVNVRINNFPDQEFGHLIGTVNSISNVPTEEGLYLVEISFPLGLYTNYHRELPLTQQMSGIAQIIIKDKRLIDQFLEPFRKLLKEQMDS